MATKVNMFLDQGADYPHKFIYKYKRTREPVSIDGYLIEMQVRPFKRSSELLADLDNDTKGGIEITNAENGEFVITIQGSVTDLWRNDEAVYDIKGTNGAVPERIVEGEIYLNKSVMAAIGT